jgi:sulfatase modifying factor 1
MVFVPSGRYWLGLISPESQLQGLQYRQHALAGFELDAAEVTVDAFRRCVAQGACDEAALGNGPDCNGTRDDRADHPANCVPFAQAEAFCRWEGKRLPSELEWEAAAMLDGASTPLHLRSESGVCLTAEYSDRTTVQRGARGTCSAGSRSNRESKLGLADIMGNVSEWTTSVFCDGESPLCRSRVLRGTAWLGDFHETYRARFREPGGRLTEGSREPAQVGFRCAR